jgi:hypothetical protein
MKSLKIFFPVTILVLLMVCFSCQDENLLPYNQVIPAEQSGLVGLWEGVSLTREFAYTKKDALGNVVNDDKNRPIWIDSTTVTTAAQGYSEYIQFVYQSNIQSFAVNRRDTINPEGVLVAGTIPSMPVLSGHWAMLKTIDPSGQLEEITSVNLFNPVEKHNPQSSILWTIKSVTPTELVVEYSFGATTYDTLFVKSFRKL